MNSINSYLGFFSVYNPLMQMDDLDENLFNSHDEEFDID